MQAPNEEVLAMVREARAYAKEAETSAELVLATALVLVGVRMREFRRIDPRQLARLEEPAGE
jgi:hypothetical protein